MTSHDQEKAALADVLDTYRKIVVWKLAGLSRDDAIKPMVPTGTSLLGIVKHLAYVERWWFQAVLAKSEVDFPSTDNDPDADWRIEDDETVSGIIDLYEQECAVSRGVLEEVSLEADYPLHDRTHSAREIILHMIEELARHVGHMDILRELVDGVTGWGPDDA
jgi:uncharacterized damage-inducible protein DinB